MKSLPTIVTTLTLIGSATWAHATPRTTTVEIPVEAGLAPSEGYDDNDNVVLVLHGMLPNSCYTLGHYKVEPTADHKTMRVKQFAIRDNEAICAEGAKLPEHLAMMVPFTTEVSVGQLPVGDYEFEFKYVDNTGGKRKLNVTHSAAQSIDSRPYAAVTTTLASDYVSHDENVKVILSGTLNSTCTELDPNIQVVRGDDVSIIMPTVRVKEGVLCAQITRPFQTEVRLGRLNPGHHLIHVRSMSGRSVNQVIEVSR